MSIKLISRGRKYCFKSIEEQDTYFYAVAKQYGSSWALRKSNGYLYDLLEDYSLLRRYFPKQGTGRNSLSKEQVISRIKKFKSRTELVKSNAHLHRLASKFRVLDLYLPSKDIYTFENTDKVFSSFKGGNLGDLRAQHRKFYNKALTNNWIEELCLKYTIYTSRGLKYGLVK